MDKVMSPTRKHRLMLLAQSPNANHKRWYSWYCALNREGLTGWSMGFAYLTDKGLREVALMDLANMDRDLL